MRVFLLDVTLRDFNEVRFLLVDEAGDKLLLTTTATKRIVYVVPEGPITSSWIEYALSKLQRYSTSGLQRDFSHSIVQRKYLLNDGTLSESTEVLRVECSGHLTFSPNGHEGIKAIFGMRTPLLEHILVQNELRGWLEFNQDASCVVRQHNKVFSTTNLTECLRRSDVQTPAPILRVVAVYQHGDDSFSYSLRNSEKCGDWIDATELSSVLQQIDPAVICAHGRSTLFGVSINFPFVFIDTLAFAREYKLAFTKNLDDAVPIKTTPLVLVADDDCEAIDDDLVFPAHDGNERCHAIFTIVDKTSAIDLTLELATITGQPWSQTLHLESKLARVEWMIMRFFHANSCIIPDPRRYSVPKHYTAGLVLDAKVGIHEQVALLDFRSLYPSVVVEYKLCWSKEGEILPIILDELIEKRKALDKVAGMEALRLCLKLLANSMYGALACPAFRFYSPDIASAITSYGRQALRDTVELIERDFLCTVIYGDTDSVFVISDDDIRIVAPQIVDTVNTKYVKLELEFEALYTKLYLLGKKCYVGFSSATPTIKGLLMIKKQSFNAGKEVCHFLVDHLANECNYDTLIDAVYAKASQLLSDLRDNNVRRGDLMIVNMLSKRLTDYTNIAGQYHVMAAKTSRVHYERGDYVRYIMFDGCTPITLDQIDDLPPIPTDVKWYCARLYAMLDQILRVLPSYDTKRFSDLLLHHSVNEEPRPQVEYTPRERRPLIVHCPVCNQDIEHWGLYKFEQVLRTYKCNTVTHLSPRIVFIDDPLNKKIFIDCFSCHCPLDLRGAINNLVDSNDLASSHANYDCRRCARQVDCARCRKNLLQFFKTTEIIDHYDVLREDIYLRIS